MKRALTAVCFAALLLFLLPGAAAALKPMADYPARPSHYGIAYEEVVFTTSDGLRIQGWFYPAQDTCTTANEYVGRLIPMPEELRPAEPAHIEHDGPAHPTIVVCDGDAANMTFLILYAYHFCTNGFNVLTFDWRGFGASDPWPIDEDQLSYTEFLQDYDAAVDYAGGRPETAPGKIGVFGYSTGAYLSFAMAARRSDVAAYAGRGLISTFADVLEILAELSPERNWHAPADHPPELQPLSAAEKMGIPALLIVGQNDVRTPPWMSGMVYEHLAGPRDLWVVPGAEHGGAYAPEFMDYPAFFVRVCAFFHQALE